MISYVTDYANGLRYISVSGMSQIEELVADTIRSLVITLLATGALGMLLAGFAGAAHYRSAQAHAAGHKLSPARR